METTDAFVGLECLDCGETVDAADASHRCPDCGGQLDPRYDYDSIDLDRDALTSRPFDSMWRYAEVLPFARETAVTTREGATPLVSCPTLAEEFGVERVLLKDEGRNSTGTLADRGFSVATTAAVQHGADSVALASPGDGGQSAAAYAARAGLEATAYLPSRSGFSNKAMVNVHGGEMNVVGGRYDDAVGAYEEGLDEHDDWYPLQPFETPYRHEGAKTLVYELLEQLEWEVPDAVVYPTGHGVGLVGGYSGATECRALGLVDDRPALYAAQASGCAPIVAAVDDDADTPAPVETPDTICGELEIPDPTGGKRVLEAIRETGGDAVATDDPDVLEAGTQIAMNEGLEVSPSAAAAISGAQELAQRGEWNGDETIVLVNAAAGNKQADVLRSHLMSQGI
ncbi:threonine synthase [Natrarchaeobaculum aegyptiacum]|uniref:Threonine synthase n=1 Tax=Natrarchaeobaculum aegyptiacum TaxID=745377 RepID=A0A2Z2HUH9_9EURY|nr:threonine synthase [Natrarchaeobaculum aegyptiacum]ARS90433.1 threonine synthase [Natrarchaeobaculum aegyptiacum]